METLDCYDPAGRLPVKLSLSSDVTTVRLGLYKSEENSEVEAEEADEEAAGEKAEEVPEADEISENEAATESILAPFRDGTRFSLDGGECYYMLYHGCVAEFTLQDITNLTLLLDFTYAEPQENQELILAMEAYDGETLLESCVVATTPDAPNAFQTAVLSREQIRADEETRAAARAAYREDGIILNQKNALEILLPMQWRKMDLEYSLERLIMTEHHTLAYVRVNMYPDTWEVVHTNDDQHHDLVLQTGSNLPQAGTYRLTLEWSYEGICYTKMQTTFFINYSAQTNYLLSSSEVPNND